MDLYVGFLFTIGIILIFSKIFNSLLERVGLPGVLGEIFLGIILGSIVLFNLVPGTLLDVRSTNPEDPFNFIAHLGLIFLLFIAGLETDINHIKKTGKVAIISTIGGVFIPLILGYIVGIFFGFTNSESLVIGVLLTATSIGITVRTMMDIGVLNTDVGSASLSASVMDDFLGITLIVLLVGVSSIIVTGIYLTVFLVVTFLLGIYVIKKIMKLSNRIRTNKPILGIAIGIGFIFAAFAEFTIVAAIEGSFLIGLCMSSSKEIKRALNDIKVIGYGFFIPLFFVYIGAQMDITVFLHVETIMLAIVITLVAVFGKLFGRGLFAKIAGFSWRQSFQMGVASIPRMEIALVCLAVAIKSGAISSYAMEQRFLIATMIFIIITTLITPPLLKMSFKKEIDSA